MSLYKFPISKILKVQTLFIQNVKFYKLFQKMIRDKILLLTKVFHSILFLKLVIIHITRKCGTTHSLSNLLLIYDFSIGKKNFKIFFQTGFKSSGSF